MTFNIRYISHSREVEKIIIIENNQSKCLRTIITNKEAWKPGENMEDEQIPADGEQEVSADRDANQDDRILFDDEVNSVEMWRCWR